MKDLIFRSRCKCIYCICRVIWQFDESLAWVGRRPMVFAFSQVWEHSHGNSFLKFLHSQLALAVPAQASVIAEGERWLHLSSERPNWTPQPKANNFSSSHDYISFWGKDASWWITITRIWWFFPQNNNMMCENINQTTMKPVLFSRLKMFGHHLRHRLVVTTSKWDSPAEIGNHSPGNQATRIGSH